MNLIWGLIGLLLLVIAKSFLGGLHPVGDSLAVFRVGLCLLLLCLALSLRRGKLAAWTLLVVSAGGIGSVLWHKIPTNEPGAITVYQKNVLHGNTELSALAMDILASDADFVTLQELAESGEPLLQELKAAYPYQLLCRYSQLSGVAVLSQFEPLGKGTCQSAYGMALITVDLPTGPHNVAAVHLAWPFPGDQPRQIDALLSDLQALEYPTLIGGDFNMVPWSNTLRNVANASGTKRATPARTTFLLGSVPISIDHVFAPGGGHAEVRPLLGADHFGLLAKVHVAPKITGQVNEN